MSVISRQDAINAISEFVTSMSVCESVDECHGMKRMQGMAVRALDALPSAELRWQTQPPKENGMYFVTTDKGGKRSVTMSGYRDEWIVEGVVAWMPIPSAYQGE